MAEDQRQDGAGAAARACTKWIRRFPSGTRKRGSRASAASCAGQLNPSAQ